MSSIQKVGREIYLMERLAQGTSALHCLHPRAKIVVTFCYLVAVVSFPRTEVLGLVSFFLYPAILIPVSETPWKPLFRRLLPALPFVALGGISNLLFDRTTLFFLWGVPVTSGMQACLSIIEKAGLSVMAVLLLAATTPLGELSREAKGMKFPGVLVDLVVLTCRYLGLLWEEGVTMYTAYLLRAPGEKGIRMRDAGPFLGNLLLRSISRAERVYRAMVCRGFAGEFGYCNSTPLKPGDLLFISAVPGVFTFFRLVNFPLLLGGIFV